MVSLPATLSMPMSESIVAFRAFTEAQPAFPCAVTLQIIGLLSIK